MRHTLSILLSLIFISSLYAQQQKDTPPLTRILFVLDGSQSMLTQWETGTKMTVARELLSELVDSLKHLDRVEMALRVYGHQKPVPPQDCNDTKLEVVFSRSNAQKIKNKLRAIRPKGTTPIAHSLELAATDFPKCPTCRNIIILITDGIESCDGDPCAVSLRLQKKGIILKPFVIGIGLNRQFHETFDCVGRYYDAANEDRFREILDVVVSQALNSTTIQVNLLNSDNKPTETDVNMTFYDAFSNEMLYNFIHTINYKGNPDTLRVDAVPTYNIQVHTLPPVHKDSVVINPGKHNVIEIPAPRGTLLIKARNNDYFKNLECIVRQEGQGRTLNVQQVNVEGKYLVGEYSVEALTIPRLYIDSIKIEQGKTATIQIPQPGLITFEGSAPAYGAIYKTENGKLVWVYNLNTGVRIQTLPILPGRYRVISRPINAKESIFTSNIMFKVTGGIAEKIVLF